jgi:hypothetical protein
MAHIQLDDQRCEQKIGSLRKIGGWLWHTFARIVTYRSVDRYIAEMAIQHQKVDDPAQSDARPVAPNPLSADAATNLYIRSIGGR